MKPPMIIPTDTLNQTLQYLKMIGREKREAFALWLGSRTDNKIKEVYIPEYNSGRNYYQITESGNDELFKYLREKKVMVLAQIHTHPNEAFHSLADDRMATVSHVGGLSFVLPDFGEETSKDNFTEQAKVYRLSQSGDWILAESNSWRQE